MSCEAETAQLLRETGYKLTPQRLLVASVIRHTPGHLTASEIFEQVRKSYPYVDISTVYRTMAVLKDLKLVTETDLGTGDAAFEWVSEAPHHHLVCRGCGALTRLDHEYLTSVGETVRRVYGFKADLDHFAIFGYCADCVVVREAAESGAPAGRRSA